MDKKQKLVVELYDFIQKECGRYSKKSSNRYDEMVNNALEYLKFLLDRTYNYFFIITELRKSINADYQTKRNNDPYASNQIINVGTDCNLFYSEGEREDEK